ncbi:MAG: pyruvate:ferredoxin (flavodoxin) oxidoreductase, partial [Acidobacteria bacterium]|nr:pyruvate:ferredoxin (flavodoxin) oxidoreductase [Acidobacteriota bacterium]
GGQASKATFRSATAKFAAAGKTIPKKDLGQIAMAYGNVYVAQIALGAKPKQTIEAFLEAERHDGPSLIIAYSPCIAHGYDLSHNADQQKKAVETGVWPLYRFDPQRGAAGDPPLKLDSAPPKGRVADYMAAETRFRMVEKIDPERYRRFLRQAQEQAEQRYSVYRQLAGITLPHGDGAAAAKTAETTETTAPTAS